MNWKRTTRKIRGKIRAVKVSKKKNGQELIRMVGVRNYSDRTRVKRKRK